MSRVAPTEPDDKELLLSWYQSGVFLIGRLGLGDYAVIQTPTKHNKKWHVALYLKCVGPTNADFANETACKAWAEGRAVALLAEFGMRIEAEAPK